MVSEFLARVFYAWIQVRNVAAAEKVDIQKANAHYRRRMLGKVLSAWHLSNSVSSLKNLYHNNNKDVLYIIDIATGSKYNTCTINISTTHQCRRGTVSNFHNY